MEVTGLPMSHSFVPGFTYASYGAGVLRDKLSPPAQVLEQTVMSNNLLLGNETNVLLTFEFLLIMLSCLSQSLD